MVKLIGSLFLIGAGSWWGYTMSNRYIARCVLLKNWLSILELLKTEIYYSTSFLPQIFKKVARFVALEELKQPIIKLARATGYGSEEDLNEIWERFLREPVFNNLKQTDLQILRELGNYLGRTDRLNQLERIDYCREKLKLCLTEAETECRKNVNLYRYLGFALGSLVVLLLV
jgi:stage III sporulation protein AB